MLAAMALSERQERIRDELTESRRRSFDRKVQHHPPRTAAVVAAHEKARGIIGQAGQDLIDLLPSCHEVDKALDLLHLALLHANTAIALHHPDNQEPAA